MSITVAPSGVAAHTGADLSFRNVDQAQAEAMRALGINLVQGYGGLGSPGKWLTIDEIRTLAAAGIASIIGGEQGAHDWQGGAEVGARHGAAMRAYVDQLGLPADVPVPFAFDGDVTPATIDAAVAYGNAAFDAFGLDRAAGVYGDIDIINALAGRSCFNWLCAARAWSKGSTLNPGVVVHMVQGGGNADLGIDFNVVLAPFQAWLGDVATAQSFAPIPLPVPVPNPPASTPPLPTLAINRTGRHDWRDPYVRVVQAILTTKCGSKMPVDANFGPVTDAEIRKFQKFFGLTVDGVVGPKQTWPALRFVASR